MQNLNDQEAIKYIYKPLLLRLENAEDEATYTALLQDSLVTVHDEIYGQLQEFVKSKNPAGRLKPEDYPALIEKQLAGKAMERYGVWAYYPWSRRLVHLLGEEEFTEVRTNRNQYKITRAERGTLSTKTIGIIGLSVGQSIAVTLAMERGCGQLRLADFDALELSNLNRIRTGVHNLGLPKVVIAAREIAEIDPYLKVSCFFDGLTEANMDDFFSANGKLDLLVDECDGLDMKIISRYKARELRIPVLMDTSDRGMLDIERFDLEPSRPILHGTVENVNPQNIKDLTNEDKVPLILQMLGAENISLRGKASMIEVEQTINTWPQLASSVALGGAVGADVARRILLNQFHDSGRYYIDLEELVADKAAPAPAAIAPNPFSPLLLNEMKSTLDHAVPPLTEGFVKPDKQTVQKLVEAACAAPSTGNDQPWKWLYKGGVLYLFHDQYRSYSFGDFKKIASFITFGAAYENLYIHALSMGLEPEYEFLPASPDERLVASIRFKKPEGTTKDYLKDLDPAIFKRHTNRNMGPKTELPAAVLNQLASLAESVPGARLQWFTSPEEIRELGKIIGACDRARLLNPEGHYDFVHREMRWTNQDAESSKDGIDIQTLGLANSQLAALGVLKDEKVVKTLKELNGGRALDMLALRTVSSASALCLISLPHNNLKSFFEGGRAMERLWLAATGLNLAVHPVISPLYLFPRVVQGGQGLDESTVMELKNLRSRFLEITGLGNDRAEVFLAKIAVAEEPALKSHRLPVEKVLIAED